jgi:hypothetical protein
VRIQDLRAESEGDKLRVAATVVWEDCDRAPQEVFFETTAEFADSLSPDPHAFLVGAVMPAVGRGEHRIAIDAPICPELADGILTAIDWLRAWSLVRSSITIESAPSIRYPRPSRPRAACFLSGGVDSLAMLRVNRLTYPADHPSAFRDCLFVRGFDIGGLDKGEPEDSTYELALSSVATVASDAQARLIPVQSNVRHLYDDVPFWIYVFHGAALASVAHAFSGRLDRVSVAAGGQLPRLIQAGTHPLIEPNFSSSDLHITHMGIRYSRLDKVCLLSNWKAALDNLRVCTANTPGLLNCGRCEKCLRTMLELLACDALNKTSAFPAKDVRSEMLDGIRLSEKYQDLWYEELIAPLTERGRGDLVEVIQEKRREFQKRLAWEEERDWKGAVKRFDRKWLRGTLHRTYSLIRNGPPPPTTSRG